MTIKLVEVCLPSDFVLHAPYTLSPELMLLLMTKDGGNEASPLSGLGQGDRQVGQGRQRLPSTSSGATPSRQ